MRLSDDTLRGRVVLAADGLALGEVGTLFVDASSWKVESFQLKLRSDVADRLGVDRGIFHAGIVEVPTRLVQSVGDAVLLSVATDGLREVLPRLADAEAAEKKAD